MAAARYFKALQEKELRRSIVYNEPKQKVSLSEGEHFSIR